MKKTKRNIGQEILDAIHDIKKGEVKHTNRNVGLAGELSEEMLKQVANSVPPAEAEAFNHEVKEE